MPRPDIVVVGSSNTDFIIRLKRLPKTGETVLGGEFMTAAGGKGANQAVAAARAGGAVCFIARLGQDPLGDQAIAGFVREGIDVNHVRRDRHSASGAALIFVSQMGDNSIAVAGGANNRLSPADVRKARAVLAQAKVVLMQLETPLEAIEAAARVAASKGAVVVLNPAPARSLPNGILQHLSILTPNESEAELLTGIRLDSFAARERAAWKLLRRGVPTVVLTMGKKGALIATENGVGRIPGFQVKPIDTTGAGDVFNGALAVALTEGRPLSQAVRFANAAAAISVTCRGAQPSAPTRRTIEKFLAAH